MSDTPSSLDKLRDLISSNPDALQGAAASGDVKTAAEALSRFASAKGLTVNPQEVEQAFRNRAAPDKALPLDDEALDKVAGGHSPYCMFTDGCYCFFTK